MAEKLSNVIGAPFDKYVLEQLRIRAVRNSTVQRTNEEVLYLANKLSWVRLISSVDISATDLSSFYSILELPVSTYNKPQSLAENWILQAGTSKKQGSEVALRSGLGPDGAYGMGGLEELGYRPLPGLTSVAVETVGRLGSLREATINFTVWNMNQLNVVEALYFRLGYSMLLEWGHVQFFNNSNNSTTNPNGVFQKMTNSFGLDDPFASTDKMVVQQKISKKTKELSGNYDGMLAIVSNFNWTMNQEGGYDCTVKLIGLGSIIGTVRINQSYKMPESIKALVRKAEEDIRKNEERREKQAQEQSQQKQLANQVPSQNIPVPKNVDELYAAAQQVGFQGTREEFLREVSYYPSNWVDPNAITLTPDYFYLAPDSRPEWNEKTFGLFLTNSGTGWKVLHKAPTDFLVDRILLNTYQAQWRGLGTGTISGQLTAFKNRVIGGRDAGYLVDSGATKLLTYNIVKVPPVEYTRKVSPIGNNRKDFTIYTTIHFDILDVDYLPSIDDFIAIAQKWEDEPSTDPNAGVLTLVDPYFETTDRAFVDRQFEDVNVFASTKEYEVTVPYRGRVPALIGTTKKIKAWLEFEFDNTSLIESILQPKPLLPVQTQTGSAANTGDTAVEVNTATAAQTEAANTYESALHVMLTTVKTLAYAQADNATVGTGQANYVEKVDLIPATKAFYQDGILKDVFKPLPTAKVFNESPFNVTYYAQKGFNSVLLANALSDTNLYDQIKAVDFAELSKAYVIRYSYSDNTSYPVYVKLGYLLAFLNNMCLLYDSTQEPTTQNSTKKTPYVYVDFNPETNLCLTSPQHLSVDPQVCLIPFEGSNNDYASILPPGVAEKVPNLFKPTTENYLRGRIPQFKNENAYQGKTMNILLNVDFLLKKVNSFATNNPENAVYLKDFLESILAEVNKSLGNLNLFRVAYNDSSNTVQIKDDQWVPQLAGEVTAITEEQQRLGELPIFGGKSLVRSLQFKTNVSTKLGSMIAISAQAATGSVNATDPSSFGYLNRNYRDRFKPFVSDAPSNTPSTNTTGGNNDTTKSNNDLAVADHFNQLVSSIYSNFNLNITQIESSKNYYIERLSKKKSTDIVTTAAPFIPADLEITIDGIAGILMGNAFTIPEDRLPLSLRGKNGVSKVGFIVAGLSHTITDNQWLTKIRGQMIKLRGTNKYSTVVNVDRIQDRWAVLPIVNRSNFQLTGNVVEDAIDFIKRYEGLYSARPGKLVQVTDLRPKTQVYAYKVGEDIPTIGWGTTVYSTGTRKDQKVRITDIITVAQAEAEIRAEISSILSFIQTNLKTPRIVSDGQMVALISMGYNAGIGNLSRSQVWTSLQQGADPQQVANLIARFAITLATTGEVLPGLVSRRRQESIIFLS